ncbi:MAG: SDR family oxidoreductase [Pseudomonadota bacterium]|nr:SDR family oxidoreductase [Pseudomonadota bacterium]
MASSDRPRHCLVTGANRGLGLEFVRQLLARGDRVIATARQPGRANDLNRLVGENPGRLHVLPLDVAAPRSHAELVRELPLLADGDAAEPIDLLINNAGVLHSGERFGSVGFENLDDSLRTNASGPFLLTQALAGSLADGATVANLSSRLGSISSTGGFGTPTYAISKAALNMATVLLAHALSERDITVVALHPGWVRTEMGGASAEIEPRDAVSAMLALIGRLARDDSGSFLDRHGTAVLW